MANLKEIIIEQSEKNPNISKASADTADFIINPNYGMHEVMLLSKKFMNNGVGYLVDDNEITETNTYNIQKRNNQYYKFKNSENAVWKTRSEFTIVELMKKFKN
jgi:hypothetical protein